MIIKDYKIKIKIFLVTNEYFYSISHVFFFESSYLKNLFLNFNAIILTIRTLIII